MVAVTRSLRFWTWVTPRLGAVTHLSFRCILHALAPCTAPPPLPVRFTTTRTTTLPVAHGCLPHGYTPHLPHTTRTFTALVPRIFVVYTPCTTIYTPALHLPATLSPYTVVTRCLPLFGSVYHFCGRYTRSTPHAHTVIAFLPASLHIRTPLPHTHSLTRTVVAVYACGWILPRSYTFIR